MYMIDLKNYIETIKKYNYAFTKVDVPYNPKSFPKKYAIGKDLDIFVCKDDFENIIGETKKYFNKYKIFNIRLIKKKDNFRLRLEKNKKLHYQIDITINNELIKNKIEKNNYYILSLENEIKVRKEEVKKNPHKKHHINWLNNTIR